MTTEREMLDRLNRRYSTASGNGFRYARAEHVKLTAGHDARRICDYMAMDLWPGYGLDAGPKLHGHEVKCSRSDLLVELRDPEKALSMAQYCDYWWLVVSEPTIILSMDELPPEWGVMVRRGVGLGIAREATLSRSAVPLPRDVQATLLRSTIKTTVRVADSVHEDRAIKLIRSRL